jgi:hypothetical protein
VLVGAHIHPDDEKNHLERAATVTVTRTRSKIATGSLVFYNHNSEPHQAVLIRSFRMSVKKVKTDINECLNFCWSLFIEANGGILVM